MDVLLTVLGIALLAVLVITLLSVLAVLLGLRSLKRRNRVSPDQSTDAPLTWLASPQSAARLHRRLRASVSVARMIGERHRSDPTPPPQVEIAAAAQQEALTIASRLTLAANLASRPRKRALRDLGAEVARIEALVSRLSLQDAKTSAGVRLPQDGSAMEELANRLDLLEAAHEELDHTDHEVGLRSPTRPPEPHQRRQRG